ncbi:hypothetical protein BDR06DRAFT_848118, partial [Suillus hirtellus]
VQWIPGHARVPGNELADKAAKEAAEGTHQNSAMRRLPTYLRKGPLPDSVSALKQWYNDTMSTQWKEQWRKLPCYMRAKNIDPTMPSNKF